jgi:hypothetical protein
VVVLVEAEAGPARSLGGFPVGELVGVMRCLFNADQAFQAAPGALQRGAVLVLGGRPVDPFALGG